MLDMDRFRHGGGVDRSGRREKSSHRPQDLRPRGGGDLVLPGDASRGGGNFPMRKQVNAFKVEANGKAKISAQRNVESLSKKASGTPVKILMEKEMQNNVEAKRHSTSVIAKLMGLDPLPDRQPGYMERRGSAMCSDKGSSKDFPGRVSREDRKQEFKDIFEVLETKALEKPKSLSTKGRSKEMAMVRQKDKLQKSEESSEASEISDIIQDLDVKFLPEPTSLFERYLRDLHSFSSPEVNHITILKSSHFPKHKHSELSHKAERTERCIQTRRKAVHKTEGDVSFPINKEHTVSRSSRLAKSKPSRNVDLSPLPTRIVVLKPSLEKDQLSARIQGTPVDVQSSSVDYRRRRECRKSGNLYPFSDMTEINLLHDNAELSRRMKCSREMAKEITNHMRHAVNGEHMDSKLNAFSEHGYLHKAPAASAQIKTDSAADTSGQADGWYKRYNACYSTETYASREAKKHLSERWMMTHMSNDVEHAADGLSTLGEMLALSDRETADLLSSSVSCHEMSPLKFYGKEVSARWISPSGISSKDGWKNRYPRGLPRSKSVPASSMVFGSSNSVDMPSTSHVDDPFMLKDILKVGSRKLSIDKLSQRYDPPYAKHYSSSVQPSICDEENKLPLRGSSVDQYELASDVDSRNSTQEKFPLSESSACSMSDTSCMVDCAAVPCDVGPDIQGFSESATDECFPANYEKEIMSKGSLDNQPGFKSVLPQNHIPGETCLLGDKEVEYCSPVSVLEPSEENECDPESFERLSADLQELRMQLELLKLESRDSNFDRDTIGDEDANGELLDAPTSGISQIYVDEEDREFSYLLNLLRDSGFHDANNDALFNTFYSTTYPVCPDAFEKHEKMYGGNTWPRAERKLLFDLANVALADILALNNVLCPWVIPTAGRLHSGCRKNLAQEVWQSLSRQRMVASADVSNVFLGTISWLDLADDVDSIGTDVERMVKDDLLEELVSDILCV